MQNLKDKIAVVFAASGEIAGAVARNYTFTAAAAIPQYSSHYGNFINFTPSAVF